jgi:hypothetical protein
MSKPMECTLTLVNLKAILGRVTARAKIRLAVDTKVCERTVAHSLFIANGTEFFRPRSCKLIALKVQCIYVMQIVSIRRSKIML